MNTKQVCRVQMAVALSDLTGRLLKKFSVEKLSLPEVGLQSTTAVNETLGSLISVTYLQLVHV